MGRQQQYWLVRLVPSVHLQVHPALAAVAAAALAVAVAAASLTVAAELAAKRPRLRQP